MDRAGEIIKATVEATAQGHRLAEWRFRGTTAFGPNDYATCCKRCGKRPSGTGEAFYLLNFRISQGWAPCEGGDDD